MTRDNDSVEIQEVITNLVKCLVMSNWAAESHLQI